MAVPPPLGNPTWQTIPTQQPYPGETLRINLLNFNARNDATITLLSSTPSWVSLHIAGTTKELVIATPTSATNADRYTIRLRASALGSGGSVVTRETSFVLQVRNAIVPTISPVRQSLQAGVAFRVDVSQFLTAGAPTPSYALRGTQNPAWISLQGSTLAGTPPVTDYTAPTTDVPIEMTVRNVGGAVNFTVNLRIARSVGPGVTTIPAQFGVEGVAFRADLSSYLAGSPTPTLLQTGLPTWMRAEGLVLRGTPSGYTQNTSETITLHIRNVVGEITHTFQLYIRVADETFTPQTTGSPIETADNNLTALTATDTRFYFYSTDAAGHITVANHGGTIERSEQINLGSANGADSTDVTGLAAHDGFLYVLGGTGAHYVFKYRLSDRALVGTQDVAGAGVALSVFERNGTAYLGVLRTTGVVQVWSLNFPSTNQIALDFTLSEPGVAASDWQSLAYDSLDATLYAGAEDTGGGWLFAFGVDGTRMPSSALRMVSENDAPRGAGYGNDRLFVAQHDSGAAQGKIYIYDAVARVLTVPPQSGFDGEPWRLDLAPYLANDITVAFRSGYAKPAWLSLSGNVLSASALPAVARSRMDDTYRILLTATHASRSTDFEVELTVKYIEVPATRTAPAQELDLRVTPTIPNVNPPLKTRVTLSMRDYVTNRERAGTLTYSVQFDDEQLTTLDGDTLTITAPTQPLADEPVSSVNLDIRVTNAVGHAVIDVPVDITNLMATYLNAIPAQDIHRNEVDRLDLSRYAGGRPRPTFALGTITPRLEDSVATIVSNANGQWSIHPDANLETTNSYSVNVIAINRISRAERAFAMTIHGVPHTDPAVAPVWHSTGLSVDVTVGETATVDLSLLISMSRPQPTFSLMDVSEFTNVGGRVSITGTTLTVTAPSSMEIDEDVTARIQVSARNSAGGATASFTINVVYASAPVWRAFPEETVQAGATFTFDVASYVSGTPTPTFALNPVPEPGDVNADATLIGSVLSWTVPASVSEDVVVPFHIDAINSAGTTSASLAVQVQTETAPVWIPDALTFTVVEGTTADAFDLTNALTAGHPVPSLYIGANAASVPARITFSGLTLLITPTSSFLHRESYAFDIVARNSSGMARKTVTLNIDPLFVDGEPITFTESDYDEIRNLIDTRLTIQELPNEIIATDAMQGGGIAWGEDAMPVGAIARTLVQLRSKRRAIIYRIAGILAASVRQAQDPRLTELAFDERALQETLFALAQAEAEIANEGMEDDVNILGTPFTIVNPTQ